MLGHARVFFWILAPVINQDIAKLTVLASWATRNVPIYPLTMVNHEYVNIYPDEILSKYHKKRKISDEDLAILFASFGWANICNINQYSSPFDVSACTNREQTTYHNVVFFIVPFNMPPAFLMRPTNEKGDTCKKNRPLFRQYLVTKPSQRKKFRLKVVEKQIIYNMSRGTFSPRTHISLDI